MTYPTIPNSFVSGNTFIASDINENYSAIVDGITDGTKDIYVSTLECVNSCNVSSGISQSTAVLSGLLEPTSTITFDNDVDFNGTFIAKTFGFGTYTEAEQTGAEQWVRAKNSYLSLKLASAKLSWITPWANYPDTPAVVLPTGSIVVVVLSPTAAAPLTVYGTAVTSGDFVGIKLPLTSIVLSSNHDKLVLQLLEDSDGGVQYWHQISYKNNRIAFP